MAIVERLIRSARFVGRLVRNAAWRVVLGSLGRKSNIYPYVVIHSPGSVRIGESVAIAEFVHIWGGGGVEIGDDTVVAAHSVITSVTHGMDGARYRDIVVKRPVRIGTNVWIGSGAIILPGVTVGDGAVIGAGAVVTRDVEGGTVVAGVPARLLKRLMPVDR